MDNEAEAATMKAVDSSLAVITVHVTIFVSIGDYDYSLCPIR